MNDTRVTKRVNISNFGSFLKKSLVFHNIGIIIELQIGGLL
jgi:hypothetical protein